MTTAAKQASAPLITYYVADDFRFELEGKVTAVGLYTDKTIVAIRPLGAPEWSKSNPLVINLISVLVTVSGLVGEHELDMRYEDPHATQTPKLSGPKRAVFEKGNSANLILKIQPLATSAPGSKKVIVTIDGVDTVLEFFLLFQNESEQSDVPQPAPRVAAPRKAPPAKRAPAKKIHR